MRPVPGREPCSECWWSCHSYPSKRWRRTTWEEGSGAVAFKRVATVLRCDSHLHVDLGVVDEILQRVSTRVVVLELCVVGDGANGGVMGVDHPADVDQLDVGEVREYSCPWSTGGLRHCTADTRLQQTCSACPKPPTPRFDTNHEVTPTGVSLSDGEAESHHRRNYRCVQRPMAVCVVPDVVEDQKAPVVSSVNNRADLNGQVDGGRAANHGNVCVF